MITTDQVLVGRDALLAAAGHHPYARHALWRGHEARGWRRDGAVGWLLPPGQGPAAGALGAAGAALDACAGLVADGTLGAGQWLHLPRTAAEELTGRLTVARLDEWDFLWTTNPPPRQPEEERVVRLTEADHPALAALIEESFPATTSRPGDPRVVGWYGIRDGGRLVACGADRSRGDIGFLAGLTVAPDRRGGGLGAALTAGMTRALFARYDHVALGVFTDNLGAIRLYRRLGYTGTEPRSSVHLG
ncbi:GNAT family N-acetyltransferase [Micromonospora sp. DR5-3]|uniref:GNAT family N-acetyltransferase n=1 Tax=unclassified Micromonospora TaxID=2617518 RepID=UPI0011D2F3B7|nr:MULTISPECIES: GNAT family N-acetyltransferase [unclassified Micromonospora]MCW3817160.1 GNAT family N-acetyltransferase [Micromonospora sp. DR5-3]TYC21895.1 GNAT family N-acetyltransferase [Micromonospora sp. MP36]